MPHRRLLVLLALLYVAEGLPYGVVNELVPVWLKVQGLSLQDLGLLQLVGLPWVLKPLWAPWVDRYGTTARWVAGARLAVIQATRSQLVEHAGVPASEVDSVIRLVRSQLALSVRDLSS